MGSKLGEVEDMLEWLFRVSCGGNKYVNWFMLSLENNQYGIRFVHYSFYVLSTGPLVTYIKIVFGSLSELIL